MFKRLFLAKSVLIAFLNWSLKGVSFMKLAYREEYVLRRLWGKIFVSIQILLGIHTSM